MLFECRNNFVGDDGEETWRYPEDNPYAPPASFSVLLLRRLE